MKEDRGHLADDVRVINASIELIGGSWTRAPAVTGRTLVPCGR